LSYTYDAWSRLSLAQAGPTGSETWKYDYNYDRFGNRTAQNTRGAVGTSTLTPTDVNTNRINDGSTSYDFAGNVTNDGPASQGFHNYTYDAENRLATVDATAATYAYDGDGLRIQRATTAGTTLYVFSGSKVIAEYSSTATDASSPTKEYVYAGGNLVATLSSSGVAYSHPDHLSTRVETDGVTGAWIRKYGHLPFGEDWYEQLQGSGVAGKLKFTTYERDSLSNLDYAYARSYSPRLGRMMQLDPVGGDAGAPQSLNGVPYVQNDPINDTDPSGMMDEATCKALGLLSCSGGGYGGPGIGGGPYYDNPGLWGGGSTGGYVAGQGNPNCGVNGFCGAATLGPMGLFASPYNYNLTIAVMWGFTQSTWTDDNGNTGTTPGTWHLLTIAGVPTEAFFASPGSDRIGAGRQGAKEAYCNDVASAAFWPELVPGSEVLFDQKPTVESYGYGAATLGVSYLTDKLRDKAVEDSRPLWAALFDLTPKAAAIATAWAGRVNLAVASITAFRDLSRASRTGGIAYRRCME
jgi:RHS repeat-associated protein